MMETWRPVVGFKGRYEVSSLGRLRSLIDRWPRYGRTRILKYKKDGRVNLRKNGKTYPKRIYRLVAAAFLGPAYGRGVLHYDDGRSNNVLKNLRYGTQYDNYLDCVRNGIRVGRPKRKGK